MKRVLITGRNSYIGTSLESWLTRETNKYAVTTLDVKDESWELHEFNSYDAVFHVAGIAHIKETVKNQQLYYKVNRDLTHKIAQKAKTAGVGQFVFLSSMSVYGIEQGIISQMTPLSPKSAYAKSKKEAEDLITKLQDDSFAVTILRPPMVYGKGCRGNYQKLARLALKIPIFPQVENQRSMIYIDHLSECVKQLMDNKSNGVFFPQNAEYVNTSEMVRLIAEARGKKIILIKLGAPFVYMAICLSKTFAKAFGTLVYKKEMPGGPIANKYETCSFEKTIERTERS